MMKLFLIMMMTFSSLMMQFNHPLLMATLLLVQTLMICLMSRFLFYSSWISLTIILVMVGGLMVIFMYFTSISSNKKMYFISFNPIIYKLLILTFFFIISLKLQFFFNYNFNMKDMFNMEFMKLFLPLNIYSSNLMFIYLLIMLIIMIEILSLMKSPMRKKY